MDALVSIVVPVYNVEKELDRCIYSLVSQTYNNLEIILVDDGATDTSGIKCDEWAEKFSCIKVIHQKNGGLSCARNTGIENATGEYLVFVDSDDWLHREAIEICMRLFDMPQVDVVQMKHRRVTPLESPIEEHIGAPGVFFKAPADALKDMYDMTFCFPMAWGKIYRTSMVKDLRFPLGKQHEDEYYTWKPIYMSRQIAFVTAELYYYLKRPESIMESKWNEKKYDGVQAYLKRIEYFEEQKEKELLKIGRKHLILHLFKMLDFLSKTKWLDKPMRNKLFDLYAGTFLLIDIDNYRAYIPPQKWKRLNLLKVSRTLYRKIYAWDIWQEERSRCYKQDSYWFNKDIVVDETNLS